uniref:Uncharacterized protein n=1 Tax=Stomoxys calcitrans TaxID=35570 RepID=A0A1I8NNE3_STOCA
MDPPIGNGYRLPTIWKVTSPSNATTMCNTKCQAKRSSVVGHTIGNQTVSSKSLSRISNNNNNNITIHNNSSTHLKPNSNNIKRKTTAPSLASDVGGQGYLQPGSSAATMTTRMRMRHRVCNLSFVIALMAVVILNNVGCFVTLTAQVAAAASAQRENTRILPLQTGMYSMAK